MATASDVRDILNLPTSSTKPSPTKKTTPHPRKEAGITRELYSLIGDHAPTLVAQYARPKLKQKPDFGRPKVRWVVKKFRNGARSDGLVLRHWVKAEGERPDGEEEIESPEDYPFARFGRINSGMGYSYSMDEYNRMLEDGDWSKEETDYLFALVKEYDVRFYVVADRYDFPGGKPRSMQDIKARYYGVCRKLIKSRPFAGDESTKNAMISSYSYDKERENQRKAYLNGLFARSPTQIAEEEALFIECKRMEQNERRFQRERDDLLRTLGGIESGLASLTLRMDDPSQYLPPVNIGRRIKRVEGMELESPIGGSSNMIALPSPYSGPSGLPGGGRHKSNSTASGSVTPKHPGHISLGGVLPYSSIPETTFDPVHCLTQPVPNSAYPPGSSLTKSSHKPVHLRSNLIPILKNTTTHSKVATVMTELGIHPARLVMPTTTNIEKFEAMQQAAIGLVDMKKALDKVDQEIRVLAARLRGGSEAADTDGGAQGDGEREQSTATADAGDMRKRSVSPSSTVSSHQADAGPRKRQKRT